MNAQDAHKWYADAECLPKAGCHDPIHGAGVFEPTCMEFTALNWLRRLAGELMPVSHARRKYTYHYFSFVPAQSATLGVVDKSTLCDDARYCEYLLKVYQSSRVYRLENPSQKWVTFVIVVAFILNTL